jgi:hypothetical protein
MRIGYFGKQNSFALETLRRLRVEPPKTSFLHGSRAIGRHRRNWR